MRSQYQSKERRDFQQTVMKESLHENVDDNEVTVTNFSKLKDLIVRSTMFPHRRIHKFPWIFPYMGRHAVRYALRDKRLH
jgi:hypothetical protein